MAEHEEVPGATEDTAVYVAGLGEVGVSPSRRRADWLTRVLVGLLIWSFGFLAGSRLQSVVASLGAGDAASDPSSEEAPAGEAPAGATPAGEAAGGPGTSGGSTSGTVKVVDGTVLYVTDEAGDVVKVVTGEGATITSAVPAALGDLRPGDDVVVRGRRLPDGAIAAESVATVGR